MTIHDDRADDRDSELPDGFAAAGCHAGIKKQGRGPDLGVLVSAFARPAAAVFTTNRLLGAHVPLCRDHLERSRGLVRAVVVNSGNANCATGTRGLEDARSIAETASTLVQCPVEQVLVLSTGVIGQPLQADAIRAALPGLIERAAPDLGMEFARAIMTTDTVPKLASRNTAGGGRITGIAKGSGMVHPDMATLLAFALFARSERCGNRLEGSTDHLPVATVRTIADRSLHRMSVDGDSSPNDTFLLWGDPSALDEETCTDICQQLARQIAADGEGATRLVTIVVRGAPDETAATAVGRAIATSPLTKTAITGRDPNWGRILSAAACAGVPFAPERARVWIGDATVFDERGPHIHAEPIAHAHLRDDESVTIGIDLAAGTAQVEVWTCDLTTDYIRINADYRS